jgi:N utilization substance protein A
MSQSNFVAAIRQIAAERGIEMDEVVEAIKHALRIAFKKDYPEDTAESLEIEIDLENDTIAAYADKKVVDDVTHPPTQISLTDAQKIDKRLKLGDHILVEITQTGDFGRVAAQAARQVITQLVREAEKESVLRQFNDKLGTVVTAIVQRVDREGNILCEINRAMAKLPVEEQISGEYYRSADQIKVLLKSIHKDAKGKILIVSRTDPAFLRALFEMEVPEIASETVEIMGIAREAGSRSKVAVRSNAAGVDPIGACVGQRGARINAITNETKGPRGEEKIDIIPWDADIKTYLANAIRPAEAIEVKIINEAAKQALVIVKDEDLSLAIGREGQNVRLAAKLTGWYLDIQGSQMYKDNNQMSKFEMDAGGIKPVKSSKPAQAEAEVAQVAAEETATDDAEAKESNADELAALGISTKVLTALSKAGINTRDELETKIKAGEKIAGVGPKALEEIEQALAA